ncbi:DmsE family decaheme c-type cytochrome [Bdellovibrionota bacterium FG-1]
MKKTQHVRRLILATLLASSIGWLGGGVSVAGVDKGSVNRCKECHEKAVNSFFVGNPHSKAWETKEGSFSCETCHGPGDKHMKDREASSIISFNKGTKQDAQMLAKQCLTCHSTQTGSLMYWKQGIHSRNDVSCANCHKMHDGQASIKPKAETCFACHKDVQSDVKKFSHHPIIEGKVTCADCHNPHGTLGHGNLKADNINQLCYKCHADKRGPFIFEHPPVEENCMNCHKSHGSQHEKLLVRRAPSLCQDCHATAKGHPTNPFDGHAGFGGPTANAIWKSSPRLWGRSCLNCHGNIHGSNTITSLGPVFGR